MALTVSCQGGRAEAQEEPRIELKWSAPEACPPRSEVIAEARRLAAAEGGGAGRSLSARATVVRTASGEWQLALQVSEPASARRMLNGESCTAVARACALLLAMMVSGAEEEPLPGEQSPPAGPSPRAEKLALPQPAPRQPPAAYSGLDGALGLRAALDVGTLPAPTPGLGLTGEIGWRMYRLSTWLGAYLPSTTGVGGVAGAEATFILAEGSLQGCVMPVFERLRVGPCLGAAAGIVWATTTGVAEAEAAAEVWVAPLAMLALRWPADASGLALEAAAGVAWPLRRPNFMLRQGAQVHQSDRISLRVQLGASWQL